MVNAQKSANKEPAEGLSIVRGQRLRQLREATGNDNRKPLTRAAIERKHGLSARTLKNWELGDGAGLTINGARRIVSIYKKENIQCSVNWLMEGDGIGPQRIPSNISAPKNTNTTDPLESIQAEIDCFLSLHPEAVTYEIRDDSMEPFYKAGDLVGGVRYYANDIPNGVDSDCIVELVNGDILVRRLQNSTVPDKYNLYSLNPSTRIEVPTLYSVEVIAAAIIVRHWRGKRWFRHR